MLAEERLYHMRLVGFVAPLHHRVQRSRTGRVAVLDHERRKGEGRRTVEIPRHEEAARAARSTAPAHHACRLSDSRRRPRPAAAQSSRRPAHPGRRRPQAFAIRRPDRRAPAMRTVRPLPSRIPESSSPEAAGRAATRPDSRQCRWPAVRLRTGGSSRMPIHIRSSAAARIWRASNPARCAHQSAPRHDPHTGSAAPRRRAVAQGGRGRSVRTFAPRTRAGGRHGSDYAPGR